MKKYLYIIGIIILILIFISIGIVIKNTTNKTKTNTENMDASIEEEVTPNDDKNTENYSTYDYYKLKSFYIVFI